jgi:predicted transcriptional regulator
LAAARSGDWIIEIVQRNELHKFDRSHRYMRIIETARDAGRKFGIAMQLLYQSTGLIAEQRGTAGQESLV